MSRLVEWVRLAGVVVFAALVARSLREWRRNGGEAAGWLVATFATLAAVAVAGALPQTSDALTGIWIRKLLVAGLLLVPYFLFRFTETFDRSSRPLLITVNVTTGLLLLSTFAMPQIPNPEDVRPASVRVYAALLLTQWSALLLLSAVRLWRSGQGQPTVARRRMRTLALGSLFLNVTLGVLALTPPEGAHVVQLPMQLLGLASAVTFFIGFSLPGFLRTLWRQPELERFHRAQVELLGADSAEDVAKTILPFASGLTGGRAAVMIDERGGPMAARGMSLAEAERRFSSLPDKVESPGQVTALAPDLLAVRMKAGYLVVDASPATPFFGREELALLEALGYAADLAIERARLRERELESRSALEEREQQLADAQRIAHLGSWHWDIVANHVTWSDELHHIYGVRPWELEPTREGIHERAHPEDRAAIRKAVEEALSSLGTFDIDHRIVRPDGQVRWLHSRGRVVVGAGNAPVAIQGTSQDVTDRRQAEARFEGLLEAAPDAFVVVDERGTITLVNRRTETLFGYPRGELVGRPVEVLVPAFGGHLPPVAEDGTWEPRATTGAALELTALREDGSEFPVDISLSPLQTERGTLVLATVRDVSERVDAQREREELEARLHRVERERLEAQLQRSQRLEVVGQLAGGIAHDFNNLLAVILNYAAFIGDDLDDRERLLADADEIRSAAERAAELTRKLLIFSRREVVRPEVIDLNAVVADIERLLRRTIGEHVELITQLAPGLPSIRADRPGLEQVVMNLAINARDAMPHGGSLTVATAAVEFDEAGAPAGLSPGRYVHLSMKDTGCGMTPEVLERALEPFFTTKPMDKGTGLGLSTVYGIITQSGGQIALDSTPGRGTVVDVFLPAVGVPATARGSNGHAPASLNAQGETVLVVEDESAVRELTRRMLSRHGYSVLQAGRPSEAMATCNDHCGPIDLLLTDMVMPEMSGKDLARRLCSVRPGMRVLYMSGYSQEFLEGQDLTEGNRMLRKPFGEATLLKSIRDALDPAENGVS